MYSIITTFQKHKKNRIRDRLIVCSGENNYTKKQLPRKRLQIHRMTEKSGVSRQTDKIENSINLSPS